jgi:hypothetical protein
VRRWSEPVAKVRRVWGNFAVTASTHSSKWVRGRRWSVPVAKVRRAWGYFAVSASSLTSKWVGEGEKMVRALFAVAKVRRT